MKARISLTTYLPLTKRPEYKVNYGKVKVHLEGRQNAVFNFNAYGSGQENCIRQENNLITINFQNEIWEGTIEDLKNILKLTNNLKPK